MKIKEYLEKKMLLSGKESIAQYQSPEEKCKYPKDISTMPIDTLVLRDFSEEITDIIKERWQMTNKLMVVYTEETKSSGLGRFLQNSLSLQPLPAGPGIFLFFKDKDLAEIYQYQLQTQGPETTKEDVLVYLALARLKNESVLSSMPEILKGNIKKYLGNNIRAIAESRKLIGEISRPGIVKELCNQSQWGIQDDEAMWVHTSLIKKLDPALRVYIGCSSLFYGDPETADIVKIHKNSSKITYYLYDDFENKPLPEMHDRIKIDLSRQKVDHFDHRKNSKPEVVYFKERFVCPSDKRYEEWKNFSAHLESRGFKPEGIHIEQCNTLSEILKTFCA